MKTVHIIEDEIRLDLTVLAVNSHVKGYNLCWHINKKLCTNFIKTEILIGEKKRVFLLLKLSMKIKK